MNSKKNQMDAQCVEHAWPWIFDLSKASSIYLWLFSPLSFVHSPLSSSISVDPPENLPEAKTSWPSLSGPSFDLRWLKNMHGPPTFLHTVVLLACLTRFCLQASTTTNTLLESSLVFFIRFWGKETIFKKMKANLSTMSTWEVSIYYLVWLTFLNLHFTHYLDEVKVIFCIKRMFMYKTKQTFTQMLFFLQKI